MEHDKQKETSTELAKLLAEAEQRLQRFKNILPSKVSREKFSMTSKSALKAYIIRAGLLHRTADLVETAIHLFKQRKDLPAFVLTRAVLETVALFYYFWTKLELAVDSGQIDEADETLMRILAGARNSDDKVRAVSIPIAIDRLDKDAPGVRDMYNNLCEIANPNWMGTIGQGDKVVDKSFSLYFEPTFNRISIKDRQVSPEDGLDVVSDILGDLLDMDEFVKHILSAFKTLHEQSHKLSAV